MRIAEIFHSVQGEGILIGTPSTFVRTSGCNLRCAWCDTPYASWNPEGKQMSVDEIVAACEARHVVVTGGEPMIAPGVVELTHKLKGRGHHITIETAGTVFEPVVCDLMSVSPKLANSRPTDPRWATRHERLRIQLDVLKRLITCYPYQLKFVVEKAEDLAEIRALVGELQAGCENVVLMPEGKKRGVLRKRGLWLVEICRAEGYRFSPRLHVELWGGRRGA